MQDRLSSEVIVLKSDGEMLGKMDFRKAEDLAREEGLDLVQVSKQGANSICKILDRGKWLYDQKKKAKAKKQQNHAHHLKEMKFGMRIDEHDQHVKVSHIKKFFDKGFDVRIVVEMRGRERAHPELATAKLNEILGHFEYDLKPNSPRKNPRHVSVIVQPRKATDGKHASEAKVKAKAEASHSDGQREAG
jgi:translation initiation factor IF-3